MINCSHVGYSLNFFIGAIGSAFDIILPSILPLIILSMLTFYKRNNRAKRLLED